MIETEHLSDIDLAVYLDPAYQEPSTGYGYQSELITELSAMIETKTDVVILNKATPALKFQVIYKGALSITALIMPEEIFMKKSQRLS